jgi:hypothetical protein
MSTWDIAEDKNKKLAQKESLNSELHIFSMIFLVNSSMQKTTTCVFFHFLYAIG